MKFIVSLVLFLFGLMMAADAPRDISLAQVDRPYSLLIPVVYSEHTVNAPPANSPIETPSGPHPFGETYAGDATYYAADGSGHCSFDRSPNNMLVAALNTADYDDAALCGAFILVSGPKGDVVVRVVDECPGCALHDIDLSPLAFEKIADQSAGRVQVTWQLYSPTFTHPVSLHFEASSSQFWTAVQVRDHRTPLATMAYLNAEGTYTMMERTNWNYFTASGMGVGPFTFRITDIFGNSVIESDIPLLDDGLVIGSSQFPHAP